MQFTASFVVGGALAAGLTCLGWVFFDEPPPERETPRESEVRRLREDLAASINREVAGQRRELLWRTYAMIWRERCLAIGTPQDWGGPVISTVYPVIERLPEFERPERIPPPAHPFPTTPVDDR